MANVFNLVGGGSANLQEKIVNITANGTTVVNPDSGKDGMSKVTVNTNVASALSTIIVTAPTGSTISVTTPGGIIINVPEVSGTWTFGNLSGTGTYVIYAVKGTKTETQNLLIDVVGTYTATITYARLPVIYQEIEYALSSGTQKVTTNTIPLNIPNLKIVLDAEFVYPYGSYDSSGFGVFTTVNDTRLWFKIDIKSASQFGLQFGTVMEETRITRSIAARLTFIIDTANGTCGIGTPNYSITINPLAKQIPLPFELFTVGTSFSVAKCYEYTAYSGTTVVEHLIPCYIKETNDVGFYDMIANTFRGNSGTGVLVAGPEV